MRLKDTHKPKIKGWKKIFHANGKEKKAGVAVLISDQTDFKNRSIVRDKKGHYIWYLSLTVWLISLSIMLSSSIHAVAKV